MDDQNTKKCILVIEDAVPISELLVYSLNKDGFLARPAYDGSTALKLINEFKPNLILLDLVLPDINGFELCKEITRKYNIPIIMLTSKNDMSDKIIGLELGADDYITKPFDIREVITRIRTIFRRIDIVCKNIENQDEESISITDKIKIFFSEHKVLKNGQSVELTPKEYGLLYFLAKNKGRVFSRAELLDSVWGFDYLGDSRTVDIHIQRLRNKLDDDKEVSIIDTVFGVGYKLVK
jgi:DNA-binding response OmpR family regulator